MCYLLTQPLIISVHGCLCDSLVVFALPPVTLANQIDKPVMTYLTIGAKAILADIVFNLVLASPVATLVQSCIAFCHPLRQH